VDDRGQRFDLRHARGDAGGTWYTYGVTAPRRALCRDVDAAGARTGKSGGGSRMMRMTAIALVGAALAALAGCQTTPAPSAATQATADAGVVDIRQAMVEGVNPAALAIWDVGNNATD